MPKPTFRRPLRWSIAAASLLLAVAPAGFLRSETPTPPADARPVVSAATRPAVVDIRKTLGFLASPALEGRGSGTAGIDIASGFIAAKFQELGLVPPPGWDNYFQPFTMTTSTTVDPATTLAAGEGVNWAKDLGGKLELTKQFQPLSFSTEGKFDAPVVFVGYGVVDAKYGYDDYAGIDVKGKVVLAMRFEPFDKEGKSAFTGKKDDYSENASIPTKAKLAAEKGAIALVLVNPPNWRNEDDVTPFAKQSQFMRASIPVIQLKQPVAEAILAASKAGTLSEVQKRIDAETKPQSALLKDVKLKGEVVFKRTEKSVRNVAAVLPGKGRNAEEYVIVGAHYDHLGRGGSGSLAPFSKDIHPGADDNASGTTAMLKLAEQIAAAGPQERSVLFIAFTAEELGLIGSDHFVTNPPVPLARVSGMLNLDMVGRIRDGNLQVGGSGTAPSFDKILAEATTDSSLKLNTKSKGGMGPSDHMSFAKKRVPVLFFFSGLHTDYHRPTDTPDKINYEGIEQVVALGEKVIRGMAVMPREEYVAKFDSSGMSIMGSSGSASGGTKVTLGIVPDYSDDSIKGVRITGTTPGSPAEAAGLKDGDIITSWDDTKLNNLMEMMGPLGKGKPGQKVKLKVLRGGKEVELEATLKERK
ncbi:M20/M25/M40 family metallo-hydrolase [Humisphaera borealis]|uniref:M20/M25/M40 family metallo-hydrolase n=1 Tax=Humisphaera borealis TaxID=2807512 RepID=A0A7M2WXZ2_9BACT|nr:M20/M25/M40 family metallo-hydrolase [Humisphaera borealis]QOV90092.1 M20/M25/M40 family metallo-hydrolase [Humisphaera borealis]